MKTTLRPFDYYLYNEAKEEIIVNEEAMKKPIFFIIFDILSHILFYILSVSFVLDIYFRYLYEGDLLFLGIDWIAVNQIFLIISGSFRIAMYLFYGISFLLYQFRMVFISLVYQTVDRYLVIFTWMCYLHYFIQLKSFGPEGLQFYLQATVASIIITCMTYILLSILMFLFEDNFIKKTLESKIREVSKAEKALKKLKKYAYDIEEEQQDEDVFCNLGGMLYLDLDSWSNERYDANSTNDPSLRNLKEPEIFNVKDALKLSNDVFLKSSSSPYSMTRENFFEIFGDEDYANEMFSEFDINHSQKISKENFRNTIVNLFRTRALLTKSMVSICCFVKIIRRIVFALAFIFLTIIFLILFGARIKEMIALLVSSAILVNFIGSNVISDLWKNIMFLLSHQFDIGDEVIVDSREMVVHDIGLISSSFLLSNGGAIKIINSDLWSKTIINMTKAPEKILLFTLNLPADINKDQMNSLKHAIFKFVKDRPFEFFDTFVVGSSKSDNSSIKELETSILLKFRNYTNRSKKFTIRAEFTAYLRDFLNEKGIIKF